MRNSLSLAAVLLGLPSCVLAAHGDALQLDQQLITASRTGHSPVSIASSNLITRDEIERQQAGSVPELLQRLAGVSITSQAGAARAPRCPFAAPATSTCWC